MDARRKRLLFLEFTSDYARPFEHIKRVCALHGCEVAVHRYVGSDEFASYLAKAAEPFDVLYVGAHGNEHGLGSGDCPKSLIRWADFADQVCGSPGLTEDTLLYLGCCYGGVLRGAQILMARCDTINYVAGLPCPLNGSEAIVAFTTFMHWDRKRASATKIREVVGAAVGEEFCFHSRFEMDHLITILTQRVPDAYLSTTQLEEVAAAVSSSEAPVIN